MASVNPPIEIPGTDYVVTPKAALVPNSEATVYLKALDLPSIETLDFGLLCRLCRARLGLDYSEIEERVDISRQTLSQIEKNNLIPSNRKIDELGKLYGNGFMAIVRQRKYFGSD